MGGRTLLGAEMCMGIFGNVGVAFKYPAQPSGFVPGRDWGGAASMLYNVGRFQGLDCIFTIFLGYSV
jgi:hypothetical protein